MSIDASFYKNVFLLAQVVPTTFEFKKHFRKGMFDRPNTAGFIHVSHFLLTIYDERRFKSMVTWPILCKTDEKRYRAEIKDFMVIVSKENPDINFPTILMSHLLQAGGIKFLLFMWKISQIALRAYIKKECETELLQAPKSGLTKDLIKIHFGNINVRRDISILQFHNNFKQTIEIIKNYTKQLGDFKKVKADIFDTKKNIKESLHLVPVSPMIVDRLMNIEDSEIIELWKESVSYNLKYLRHKNDVLNDLQMFSHKLCNVVLALHTKSNTLNASLFPRLKNETNSILCTHRVTQVIKLIIKRVYRIFHKIISDISYLKHPICGLYKNDFLVLKGFFSTFNLVLENVLQWSKINNLPNLSTYHSQITHCCETINIVQITFEKLVMNVLNTLYDVQHIFQDRQFGHVLETEFLHGIDTELILTSPEFIFFLDEYPEVDQIISRLWPSPKDQYKDLFKRYKRSCFSSPIVSASKSQLSESMQKSISNWKSPKRSPLVYKRSSPITSNVSPKYKRLFSVRDGKTSSFKDHNAASTPNRRRLSTPPKKSNILEISKTTTRMSLDTAKNLYDLTREVTNVVASLCGSPLKYN